MKKLFAAAAVLVLVGVLGVLVVVWLNAPRHRINRPSYEAIRLWMSEQEVLQILGVPAGDYRAGRPSEVIESREEGRGYRKAWESDAIRIAVTFDADGRVVGKSASPREISILDWFRGLLGL